MNVNYLISKLRTRMSIENSKLVYEIRTLSSQINSTDELVKSLIHRIDLLEALIKQK